MFEILEEWFARRWLKRQVQQGGHGDRIQRVYILIKELTAAEFTEDNIPTLESFLAELFVESNSEAYTDDQVRLMLSRLNRILSGEFGIPETFITKYISDDFYRDHMHTEVNRVSRRPK